MTTGFPFPQGATLVDGGVNFSLYSANATAVTLCLYDNPSDNAPSRTIPLNRVRRRVWFVFVPGVRPGQLYGYKVDGAYDPRKALRFNRQKLLLDPYAKAVTGTPVGTDDRRYAFIRQKGTEDYIIDPRPNDDVMPKCVVVDDAFDWQGVKRPHIPLHRMVIYEVHVKGFTAHPSAGVSRPGTFAGFIEKIPYLKELGVNAVELLPIAQGFDEDHLSERGLTNYWGYNPIAFFAPDARFSSTGARGEQVAEFKTLVRECHRAGIEVILDVVYNHTCEGNNLGPSYAFKGIDNPTYYKHQPGNPRYDKETTGCGNMFDLGNAQPLRVVMDALRYWAQVCHVDGFRFDLATALARTHEAFDPGAPFLSAVSQDPILADRKLIAEPWDLGYGGYQLGAFPIEFQEWNGRFRDNVRMFLRGDGGQIGMMGYSLTGSSDLFAHNGRSPCNSINFLACHDGFTLYDTVSYNEKHNRANREENRDGADENFSHNHGAEGETSDAAIRAARLRTMKNAFSILMLSFGTPMICAGDEFARSQQGNNNAYCQDNALSWLDYTRCSSQRELFEFVRRLLAFRQSLPFYERAHDQVGATGGFQLLPDIRWFGADGGNPDWGHPDNKFLAFLLAARHSPGRSSASDSDLLMIMNMGPKDEEFPMPKPFNGDRWARVIDTDLPSPEDIDFNTPVTQTATITVPARTVAVYVSRGSAH